MSSAKDISKVKFFFHEVNFSFTRRLLLKRLVVHVFTEEKAHFNAIHYIFCTDQYLLTINQSFLQHDDYTDIITFNLAQKNAGIEGEIYISIERVSENARLLHIKRSNELLRVIIHGALHLCGYKDKTTQQALQMRSREAYYMDIFNSY